VPPDNFLRAASGRHSVRRLRRHDSELLADDMGWNIASANSEDKSWGAPLRCKSGHFAHRSSNDQGCLLQRPEVSREVGDMRDRLISATDLSPGRGPHAANLRVLRATRRLWSFRR
jgi:hypothetical protein